MSNSPFDLTLYDARVAESAVTLLGTYPDEAVAALDLHGTCIGTDVWLSLAHQNGVIHRTADVIAVMPDGQILLQERRSPVADGTYRFALSAGGHVASGATAEVSAITECREELGIDISAPGRLVSLCDAPSGWALSYFEAVYMDDAGRHAVIHTTETGALAIRMDTEHHPLNATDCRSALKQLWQPPPTLFGGQLTRWTFNQEFDVFYIVRLSHREAEAIAPRVEEVRSVRTVQWRDFVGTVRSGMLMPDTTHCLLRHGGLERLQAALLG